MGWPLANIIYELWPRDRLPDFSTPVGKMFIYLWMMRQEREFLANRALIQATIAPNNGKVVKDVFEDLKNASNPYMEEQKKQEDKKTIAKMLKEIKKGALAVTPTNIPIIPGGKSLGNLRQLEQLKAAQPAIVKTESQFTRKRTR